jgi:hypothetical protein
MDAPSEAVLEEGTRHEIDDPDWPGLRLVDRDGVRLALGSVRKEVLTTDARHGSRGLEIITESGEEFACDVESTGKQRMEVLALRDAVASAR